MDCACVCALIPFILDVKLVDVPAGVSQGEGHPQFLLLPFAVLALTFIARRIQPFLCLVERKVDFWLLLLLFLTFSVLVANPKNTTLYGGQSSRGLLNRK